jgi:pilus assembly protein TadC
VQIKLLFPLILFIFPTVMIVVLFPAGLRLMEALGNLM